MRWDYYVLFDRDLFKSGYIWISGGGKHFKKKHRSDTFEIYATLQPVTWYFVPIRPNDVIIITHHYFLLLFSCGIRVGTWRIYTLKKLLLNCIIPCHLGGSLKEYLKYTVHLVCIYFRQRCMLWTPNPHQTPKTHSYLFTDFLNFLSGILFLGGSSAQQRHFRCLEAKVNKIAYSNVPKAFLK